MFSMRIICKNLIESLPLAGFFNFEKELTIRDDLSSES